jgi:hypothetical protein
LVLVLLHYRKQESKKKKNAQARLENEKQQILKKLSQKIINKFEPITKQHKEAAIYAVKENEDYHWLNTNMLNV